MLWHINTYNNIINLDVLRISILRRNNFEISTVSSASSTVIEAAFFPPCLEKVLHYTAPCILLV
jgi:hypothetical protein